MHMVTETRQLRDGEKLTEFFNRIERKHLQRHCNYENGISAYAVKAFPLVGKFRV